MSLTRTLCSSVGTRKTWFSAILQHLYQRQQNFEEVNLAGIYKAVNLAKGISFYRTISICFLDGCFWSVTHYWISSNILIQEIEQIVVNMNYIFFLPKCQWTVLKCKAKEQNHNKNNKNTALEIQCVQKHQQLNETSPYITV